MLRSNLTLRPATDVDAAFVRNIYFETQRHIIEVLFGWRGNEVEERKFVECYDAANTLILLDNGENIGWMTVQRFPDHIHLDFIYVSEAKQNQGIGTSLIRDLIRESNAARIPLRLGTAKINEARRLYERLGFAEVNVDEFKVYMEHRPRLRLEEPPVERRWVLALDAMGVLYRAADDVAELLVPFVRGHCGLDDVAAIETAYTSASLGYTSADALWASLGLSPELEDAYLAAHEMIPGVEAFLETARRSFSTVYCASNDVARWSRKLRQRFRLESLFDDCLISGELGIRKPDARFFAALIATAGVVAANIVIVDDRAANVTAAARCGMHAVLFGSGAAGTGLPSVADYEELTAYMGALNEPQ